MKTFADVKRRFRPGVVLECAENTHRPELTGTRRRIERVQTNAIAWVLLDPHPVATKPGALLWTYFPPASGVVVIDADTFQMALRKDSPDHVRLRFCVAS